MSLPTGGGTPRTVLRHPVAAVAVERGFLDSGVAHRDGHSLLVRARISGIDDPEEMSVKSMAGFGN
ncbi:hypothetical protein [Streptomyces sp. NPDC014734]|uniref:hypothetical protein n=1 Tax=Streptomyces sp. NPDC014734 TaxID=3364886 RepID=UPI0036FB46D6